MKKIIAIIAAVLMLTAVLTACGNKDEETATPDSATADSASAATRDEAVAETTVVVEKTADGGTIEKDSEDNLIEIDKSGEIVSIKDKDGGSVVVTEYLTTHYFIASNGMTYGNPDAQKSGGSSQSGSSSQPGASSKESGSSQSASSKQERSSSSSSSKENKNESSSSEEEAVEGEIPTVIVELPESMDEYELPVL